MHIGSLVVLLIFGFPFLIVGGFFLIWAIKLMKGGKDDGRLEEETRLIQEIHQGLLRMEQRIETLETILLDPERDPERKGSK